ncbi:MAG: c-type cytochrome [Alphaproteobacteria bacterium]|nr:c-type cytochrome [Alphaproteobacteria bacterium]
MNALACIAACLTVLLAVAGPAAAQSLAPTTGHTLAATCTSCHGPGGRSPGAMPSINGRSEAEIAKTMHEFKDDSRPATVMNRHAKGFSDGEIAAIAKEVASWR